MKITVKELADCLSGSLMQPRLPIPPFNGGLLTEGGLLGASGTGAQTDHPCAKAHIDSREVGKGSIFFCLKGERSDGHDFAGAAALAGAAAIVAERDPFARERNKEGVVLPAVLLVDDALKALWRLALLQRSRTRAKVIGVTGSAGKTTFKESLAHILSGLGKTEKNYKNFNTQIGLPLCMINADEDADFWVMEAGISQPHDMDELGMILRPDAAVVLNVATAHAEGLGDRGVAWHKARLFHYLADGGLAFVSADYPSLSEAVDAQREALSARGAAVREFSMDRYGVYSHAAFIGLNMIEDRLMGRFEVAVDGRGIEVEAPFVGTYGSENVAALAAVALAMDVPPRMLRERLASVTLPDQRFRFFKAGDAVVIDDSYNANPLSSERMIRAAANIAEFEKKDLVLVMGEMLELGGESGALHEALGKNMAQNGAVSVVWKGDMGSAVKAGLSREGYRGTFAEPKDTEEFSACMKQLGVDSSVILFKGSRSNHLEEWLAALTAQMERVEGVPRAV